MFIVRLLAISSLIYSLSIWYMRIFAFPHVFAHGEN